MKKNLCLLISIFYIISMCSCSKDDNVQTEKQKLVINESSLCEDNTENTNTTETAAVSAVIGSGVDSNTTETTISKGISTVQTGIPHSVANAGSESVQSNMNNITGTTVTVASSILSNDEKLAEDIFGAQGKTDSEWLAFGQELYKEGCDTAFRFLCTGSQFPFDRQNLEIIDKTYFLTTCSSFDDATEAYYKIFSRQYHSNDFDGLLIESGGRLYAARAARGMDMTYLSSEVDKLIEITDTEIKFSVIMEYEDNETTAEFTLVPEDGEWKIGKFTLPY